MKLASGRRSVGYRWLRERHTLACLPHHVESFAVDHGTRRTESMAGRTEEIYPKAYWPGDGDFAHLEFALRHEGLHLQLLRDLLPRYPSEQVTNYVRSKPTSAYARRLWLMYEEFSGRSLPLPDVTQGNYVDLLDEREYYAGTRILKRRQRVNVNLLGTFAFSPMVRRTRALREWEARCLDQRCRQILNEIPPALYDRALQYLYTKETKSSYAIERETPDRQRAARFAAALRQASQRDYLVKANLVELQREVVEPRFANSGWRDTIQEQNYVGTSLSPTEEQVHFIPPQPKDLPELMSAFLDAGRRILSSEINPVIAACAIAYPFVFLHPFSDGNGRLHRFLIHYVLSHLRFVPESVVFPVSATMLHRHRDYDESLEAFSGPLMPLINYEIDDRGRLTVLNETRDFYRYIDCTPMAETLFSFVQDTIEKELTEELRFLEHYDEARRRMQVVVDMPNRQADLFVRLCLQGKGRLSKAKRQLPEFLALTEAEIANLEAAVREAFDLG